MTLGAGKSMAMSKAHKLNTKSSTEAELVGVYDALPDILWRKYFLEAQGYKIEHNVLLQDNKSTILLATNGVMSSSKKTKHIRHRFFLIRTRLSQGMYKSFTNQHVACGAIYSSNPNRVQFLGNLGVI